MNITSVLGQAKPGRKIEGHSAVLLPIGDGGEILWSEFEQHVAHTHQAGLGVAANMDTGYVNVLSADEKREVLRRVRANGGIVMVNFAPGFVSEAVRVAEAPIEAEWQRLEKLYPGDRERVGNGVVAFRREHPVPRATLAQVADHIDHIRTVAGTDHVGLGSDFDGIGETPDGLEDVSRYPDLLVELASRGYSDDDLRKVAGANILRVMRAAEQVAARLQRERRPSEARIELVQPPAATAAP